MARGRKSDSGPKVLGPYYDNERERFMYAVVVAGVRTWCRCRKGGSKEEAEAEVEGARQELLIPAETTVEKAIERYLEFKEEAASKTTADADRCALLPLKRIAADVLIASLSAKDVERYVAELSKPQKTGNRINAKSLSMASKRSYFLSLTRASKWWHKRHFTAKDVTAEYLEKRADPLPWETKAGSKLINRGKAQLRNLGEAQRYLSAALARTTAEERVASALPILTGISSGELLHIQAGAVDLDAGVIHVRNSETDDGDAGWSVKTVHRVRAITIPSQLRNDIEELASGLAPATYLFRAIDDNSKNGHKAEWRRTEHPRNPTWLRKLVQRVCVAADVKEVCPHGLRATHASLRATVADEAVAKIGDALGHSDHGKTAAAHYVGAQATVPVLKLLAG